MKKPLLFIALCTVIIFGVHGRASADVNDFVINSFDAEYTLSRNDNQGEMTIIENIDLTFSHNNHGIIRAIPASYNNKSLNLKVIQISSSSGASTEYTTYEESGNTVLKIGNPNSTITGKQTYVIEYSLQNVISFHDGYDELYWDINGDQWQQPFTRVSAKFNLPKELTINNEICYTGSFGGTGRDCSIMDGKLTTTRPLEPTENLSAVIGFPKGYFAQPTSAEWWQENYAKVLAVVIPPFVIGFWAYRRWYKNGRDIAGRGTIIAEYQPPKDLSPAEAGVIMNYRLDQNEISATIIDLAIRGFIQIVETEKKGLIKKSKKYSFVLKNTKWEKLKSHEVKILTGLFRSVTLNEEIEFKDLKDSFYKTSQSLQRTMPKSLSKSGYFPSNPTSSGLLMWIVFVGCLILAIMLQTWVSLGLLATAVVVFTFAVLMPSRTQLGVQTKDTLDGLKLYMETAEKDRINMLQSPDSPYSNTTAEPRKSVELFEKLLPFAIVLGVEKKWAGQFEQIYRTPPDWYSGNWTTFNAVYLTSALSSSVSAMGTDFSPPTSSNNSGFSGGGGGGGGGGGW